MEYGLVTLILSIILKEYRREYAIYVSIIGGLIILSGSLEMLGSIVKFITSISSGTSYNKDLVRLLLKITGISILVQYAVNLCKDSGESAIASKIDLGGKIIIISLSIPVISASMTMLLELLP